MKGNTIIVNVQRGPSGIFREGFVKAGETFRPGMAVQIDSTVTPIENAPGFRIYTADANGGRPKGALGIVTEILQIEQGKSLTDTIAAGERVMVYFPEPGDWLNLLLTDAAGTGSASDFGSNDMLIPVSGTGEWVLSTGTPEIEPAMLLEDIDDMTADTLGWAEWTGY